MNITAIDHLVLTVASLEKTIDFYVNVLGMTEISFGNNRKALAFGQQKINLHEQDKQITPHAKNATCGSGDICLLTNSSLHDVMAHLHSHGINIIDGIVPRTGALGTIHSIYVADPDGNLIEISSYHHV